MSLYVGALPADIERRRYAPAWDPVAGGIVLERPELLRAFAIVDVIDSAQRALALRLFTAEQAAALPADLRRKLMPARAGGLLALTEDRRPPIHPTPLSDLSLDILRTAARNGLRLRADIEAADLRGYHTPEGTRGMARGCLSILADNLSRNGYRAFRLGGETVVPTPEGDDLGPDAAIRFRAAQVLAQVEHQARPLPGWLTEAVERLGFAVAEAWAVQSAARNRRRKRPISEAGRIEADRREREALRRRLLWRGYAGVRFAREGILPRWERRRIIALTAADPETLPADAVYVAGA